MDAIKHDVSACMFFRRQHRPKPHRANPIDRLNKEVKRRADVVGVRAFLWTMYGWLPHGKRFVIFGNWSGVAMYPASDLL